MYYQETVQIITMRLPLQDPAVAAMDRASNEAAALLSRAMPELERNLSRLHLVQLRPTLDIPHLRPRGAVHACRLQGDWCADALHVDEREAVATVLDRTACN